MSKLLHGPLKIAPLTALVQALWTARPARVPTLTLCFNQAHDLDDLIRKRHRQRSAHIE